MSLPETFLGSSFDQGREHYEGVWEVWIELSLSILNCNRLFLLMKGIFSQWIKRIAFITVNKKLELHLEKLTHSIILKFQGEKVVDWNSTNVFAPNCWNKQALKWKLYLILSYFKCNHPLIDKKNYFSTSVKMILQEKSAFGL